MKFLLCTDGSPHTAQGLDMGVRIAQRAASAVEVLVVDERGPQARLMGEEAAAALEKTGIPTIVRRRDGQIAEELVRQAGATPYDLVVIGSRGRKGAVRLLLGSLALHVSEHTPAPVLIVKGRARDIERVLICSSAGPASEHTISFAGRLAHELDASVTLLHVMSQLPLTRDAVMDDLGASAEELIRRGSREGVHLSRMLALLAGMGVTAQAAVRHGMVQNQVIAESRKGRYDLLVIGTHITPGLNGRLIDDLSRDILLAANRPVLVVRYSRPESAPRTGENQVEPILPF